MCCITRHPLQGGVRGPRGSRELAEADTSGCGAERRGGSAEGLPGPRTHRLGRRRAILPLDGKTNKHKHMDECAGDNEIKLTVKTRSFPLCRCRCPTLKPRLLTFWIDRSTKILGVKKAIQGFTKPHENITLGRMSLTYSGTGTLLYSPYHEARLF